MEAGEPLSIIADMSEADQSIICGYAGSSAASYIDWFISIGMVHLLGGNNTLISNTLVKVQGIEVE